MEFVLVDKGDNIVDRVDLQDVGINGAMTYFVGRKQIPYENFIQLWKVMSSTEYDRRLKESNRQNKQFEWWKEDDGYLDIDQ